MAVLGSWVTDLFVATLTFLLVRYCFKTASKRRKYAFIKQSIKFRDIVQVFTGKLSLMKVFNGFYGDFKKAGYGGVYSMFGDPILIVCKPDLIKQIITKDFNSFHDRGLQHHHRKDQFSAHLVNLRGARWKNVRAKLSPTFASAKIKVMFPMILECTQELVEYIQSKIKENKSSIEVKDLLVRFSTDVIGSCAFGIQCRSLKNFNNEFYTASREILNTSTGSLIRQMIIGIFPFLRSVLTFKRQFPLAVKFFSDIIRKEVRYRKNNNVERDDFVQSMIKIHEKDKEDFSLDVMVANTMIFFFAGLDNIAQPLAFGLLEMARNPDLQEKVYQEITTVLEEHNSEMSYEALGKMELVHRVIDEALRMYSPAGILVRNQTGDKFVLPDSDIVTEKGTVVMVPIQSLHRDPEYYPNPDKFDPDRFTEEEKQKRHPYTYLPFGEGPRICIASRFALLEQRLCFVQLIRHFQFRYNLETDITLEGDLSVSGLSSKNGVLLAISEREKK